LHILMNEYMRFVSAVVYGLAVGIAIVDLNYYSPALLRWLVVALVFYMAGSGVAYSLCLFRHSRKRLVQRLAIVLSMIVAFALLVSGYPLTACRECTLAFRLSFTGLTTGLSLVIILVYMMNLGIPTLLFAYNCVRLGSFDIAIAKSFAKERRQRKQWRKSCCWGWLSIVAVSIMVSANFVFLRFAIGT